MNKISVLLAVKNGEKYIRKSIDSILNQTYENLELIIIVNCCIDSTYDIVKSYDDPRIKVLKSNICQLSFNLNLGLSYATGEYIARIDADDICMPDRFEKQLNTIISNDYDVIGSNLLLIDENDNEIGFCKVPETNINIRKKIYYRFVIAHPTMFCKKEVLLRIGGYIGGIYAEDYDLWLRIMRDEKIIFYNIQEPLIRYRIHSQQSKGNLIAYAEVAGFMLREFFVTKSIRYFVGSFIYFLKCILSVNKLKK